MLFNSRYAVCTNCGLIAWNHPSDKCIYAPTWFVAAQCFVCEEIMYGEVWYEYVEIMKSASPAHPWCQNELDPHE